MRYQNPPLSNSGGVSPAMLESYFGWADSSYPFNSGASDIAISGPTTWNDDVGYKKVGKLTINAGQILTIGISPFIVFADTIVFGSTSSQISIDGKGASGAVGSSPQGGYGAFGYSVLTFANILANGGTGARGGSGTSMGAGGYLGSNGIQGDSGGTYTGGGGGSGIGGGGGGSGYDDGTVSGGSGSPARNIYLPQLLELLKYKCLGGGGGGNPAYNSSNLNGAGGGLLFIVCNTISGSAGLITANGLAGSTSNTWNGGGGGGGAIVVCAKNFSTTPTMQANGGAGATYPGKGSGGNGGAGITLGVTMT